MECTDPRVLAGVLVREATRTGYPGAQVTERGILLRSDANAPYGLAQQTLDVCARMGFARLQVACTSRRPR